MQLKTKKKITKLFLKTYITFYFAFDGKTKQNVFKKSCLIDQQNAFPHFNKVFFNECIFFYEKFIKTNVLMRCENSFSN